MSYGNWKSIVRCAYSCLPACSNDDTPNCTSDVVDAADNDDDASPESLYVAHTALH